MAKEWRQKNKTDRDWSKIKVIGFNENKVLQVYTKKDFWGDFYEMKLLMKPLLKKHDQNEEKKLKKREEAAEDNKKKKKGKKGDADEVDKKKKRKGKSSEKVGMKEEVKESDIKKFISD